MKDKFSYIIPPSPTSTVAVDSYYPTSNWWNGRWQYQDQSYLLHNPALRLPIERPYGRRDRSADGSRAASASSVWIGENPTQVPNPSPEPSPSLPEKSSQSNAGWYVAGGIGLLAIGFALMGTANGVKIGKNN